MLTLNVMIPFRQPVAECGGDRIKPVKIKVEFKGKKIW